MPALLAGISPHVPARGTTATPVGAADADKAGTELSARNFSKDSTAVEFTL
jgi:hypothetical protein